MDAVLAPAPGAGAARRRPSPERERKLVLEAKRCRGDGRLALIEAFEPSIAGVARIYRRSAGVSRAELMQQGVVGMLRALERYDMSSGTPFWGYACWWVRQAMQELVSELARCVVLSDRAARQLARVRDAQHDHIRCFGRDPTAAELAAHTGLARRQVENLIAAGRTPRALEEPIGGEEDVTFGDLLPDPCAGDAYDRIPDRLDGSKLHGLMAGLSERERAIVTARYGFDGPEQTLRQLGWSHGVSVERIRQIEERALEKLREAVGGGADAA